MRVPRAFRGFEEEPCWVEEKEDWDSVVCVALLGLLDLKLEMSFLGLLGEGIVERQTIVGVATMTVGGEMRRGGGDAADFTLDYRHASFRDFDWA